MTGKNLTHIRALYDLDQDLDARFPRTTYAIEHPGVFSWARLNKDYMFGIPKQGLKYDAGSQTTDALIMDDSDISETIELLEDEGERRAILLPEYAFRIMRRHFLSWKNKFLRVGAMNLKRLEQEMSPKRQTKAEMEEIERRRCRLRYGASSCGIRPVRFDEYTVKEKITRI